MFFSVLSTSEFLRATALLPPSTKSRYRLHTGKTVQIHGRWWQRRTTSRNRTSGVSNLFPNSWVIMLDLFQRWVSDGYLSASTGTFRKRFPRPPCHRTRKSLSGLSIGHIFLIPNLITMPQVTGGLPFQPSGDQRTSNHQTPCKPSLPSKTPFSLSLWWWPLPQHLTFNCLTISRPSVTASLDTPVSF